MQVRWFETNKVTVASAVFSFGGFGWCAKQNIGATWNQVGYFFFHICWYEACHSLLAPTITSMIHAWYKLWPSFCFCPLSCCGSSAWPLTQLVFEHAEMGLKKCHLRCRCCDARCQNGSMIEHVVVGENPNNLVRQLCQHGDSSLKQLLDHEACRSFHLQQGGKLKSTFF